ncbi:MAG: hypothetical protein ACM3KE_12385 [Hyphomicrobiales bacterium]
MSLEIGNKNVVVGLLVLMLYLAMSFFIERTSALHQFHEKAAAAVVDTKGTADLLDDQVVDMKRGPAYRTGGIYFTNHYPNSYVRVFNSGRDAAYNMRWYAWWFALFNITIGVIVGIQKKAGARLRSAASWLALIGLVLYPLRDTLGFWGRYLNPNYSPGTLGPVMYPLMWAGGTAMFLALLFSILVFVQGTRPPVLR